MPNVIDGNSNKIIETFHISDTDKKIAYYKGCGYENVDVDIDGDIIVSMNEDNDL